MPQLKQVAVPILLIILDGMADRPYQELKGRTPLEAAHTPVMDRLAAQAQSGFYYPLGPGRIPSSELSHFRLFGYGAYPFPGRACLEALGHGIPVNAGDTFSFLALRQVERSADGSFQVVGGYGESIEEAPACYAALNHWQDPETGYHFEVFPIPTGEAILLIRQGDASLAACGDVTDSDPFFFTDLPVLRPRPLAATMFPKAAALTADALNRFLSVAAKIIETNFARSGTTRLVVSKWTGTFTPLPSFTSLTGLTGISIASSALYQGLARLIGFQFIHLPEGHLADKVDRGLTALRTGEAGFVHVHTKEADEAAHSGDAAAKVAVIEKLDQDLTALLSVPPEELVLCITSDHCTPINGRTVHWGDSVPLLVRGPYVRVDNVTVYDERSAIYGSLGQIGASDLLPYLLCQADQAHFLGARPVPIVPWGIPQSGEPWYGTGTD
jgi:2,3-bisphosphoglycerate-independent phosphoglycerate mutase